MSTRSLTVIKADEWGEVNEIIVMYKHFDGYPEGYGKELAKFLAPYRVVNGLNGRERGPIANGAGCLAAQIVKHFTKPLGEGGDIHLHPAGTRGCWSEYVYTVTAGHDKPIRLQVEEVDTGIVFDGAPADYAAWVISYLATPEDA